MTQKILAQVHADQAILAGLQKNNASSTFTLLSVAQTSAQVVGVLQARVAKAEAVFAARAALHQAVLDSRAEDANSAVYVRDLRQALLAMYSNSPQTLADYALTPPKARKPLTAEQELDAKAKRAATRAARHTLGKVAKAKIKGTLGGPVVVQADGSSKVATGGLEK